MIEASRIIPKMPGGMRSEPVCVGIGRIEFESLLCLIPRQTQCFQERTRGIHRAFTVERHRQSRMGGSKHRVEFEGMVEKFTCHRNILRSGSGEMPHSPVIAFPGSKIAGRLAQGPPLFGIGNGRSNGPGDCKRNFVLHGEDIDQVTIVTLAPRRGRRFLHR